ncbi:metastasis suppressor protein 1 [Elysia marginata]|uniref:Metastasis suppressor protein 1 n=1 Tax=Elysia marginata TaxID=1093978 RepID=A0AAV4GBX3_9GAST|nr:metastasis suppressor protein 1 [Elysia marginata]
MEANPEKDSGVLGSLFQTVINDMRGSTPIWEDFTYKSMKLHSSLKTTVVSIGAFLEAFQKVADMATSSKGATREIGSALTRLCLRHRSIESQLKLLTSSIVDNLVSPLQEKLEDWKKSVAQLDKDHAKEYKKAKQEIKKAASDTMRLQKKVKKGGSSHGKTEMQHKLDASMLEVNSKYHQLEETEKNSLRSALIEERSRFCLFITCLKPFVDSELKLLTEMSHIQEIMHSLCLQASDPASLPESSEQVITDLKGVDGASFNFTQQHHHSPPSSPSSLGSRKSSMCSINSINSSSSGSSKSHSPSHTMHKRTASQQLPPGALRLTSVSSQDSGFTSQDTLFLRPNTPQSLSLYQTSASTAEKDGEGDCDSTPTTPSDSTPSASSTWNNWPNLPAAAARPLDPARPHTISSAYEKGHNRPALKPDMFEPPVEGVEMRPKTQYHRSHSQTQYHGQHRPSATISKLQPVLPPHCPKPTVKAVAPPTVPPSSQPIYANMEDLGGAAGHSDVSPDDGEPTTPTTPACNPLAQHVVPFTPASQQLRPDGMDVLHAAMQQMNIATASLGISNANGRTSTGVSVTAADGDSEDVSSSQEVTPRSSVDEPGGLLSLTIDPDPLEVGKALARPKARIITTILSPPN